MFTIKILRKHDPVKPYSPSAFERAAGKIGRWIAYSNPEGRYSEGQVEGFWFDQTGVLSYYVRNERGLVDSVSIWNFRRAV